MYSALAAFVLAFVVTTFVTPRVRRMATGAGVVDAPGGRRVHVSVTPRLGGVAVMLGFFVPLAAFAVFKTALMRSFLERPDLIVGLVLGSLVVGVVGAIDDVRSLGPWMKLAAQAVAAVIAYAFGYRIDAIHLPLTGSLDMGLLSLPLTVFWFLAITNAVNLIDGLDGLAVGIAIFTTVANFAIAFVFGSNVVMLLSAALGGSLLGFLRYNFNPATIFLGDSGSMFLGFTLAATSIGGQLTKSSTAVTLLAPVLALGIPIVDTLLAMVRRTVARQSIFAADRGHIHHKLLDLGFTHRRVVLTLYGLSVALAVCAVAVAIGHAREIGVGIGIVGVSLFGIVRAVRVRRSVQKQEATVFDAQLDVLGEFTRHTLDKLALVTDEGALRACLSAWNENPLGVRAEYLAGEPTSRSNEPALQSESLLSFEQDMSSAGRRRHFHVTLDPRSDDAQHSVLEHVRQLAAGCRDAAERSAKRTTSANTARLRALSAHLGSDE